MDSNSIPGGMYSNMQPGMLGLEMSLQQNTPPQIPQNPHHVPHQHPHPLHPMAGFGHLEGDYHPQAQQSVKQGYPVAAKSKNQSLTLSDDDEPGLTAENSADDGKKKLSPWHRMKWTDNMVRLLIMVVFYIGDEVGSEGNDPKKKTGGILQKKGKWKSVSRAMMERGFYVSPQQCEDKFNDLNKRYKRVNDIIGKGTACRVVENHSLLETMDHISPKLKEEVKKLLNSKHLFFKEMCAYHSSCGHGSGATASGSGTQLSPQEVVAEPSQPKQRCLHSTPSAIIARGASVGSKLEKAISSDDDEEDDDEDDEDDEDGDEDEVIGGGSRVHEHDVNSMDERWRKRMRNGGGGVNSPLVQHLDGELANLLQDEMKSAFEKTHWMKTKLMQLEENRVGILSQAYEIEKQRLKWFKFSTKKEREMEREKLTNERLKLENERMVLLVRKKELDMLEQQQQQPSNRKSYHSSVTG